MTMMPLSSIFKPYTDAIRSILNHKKIEITPETISIVELQEQIEKNREIIKAAFDNDIIDLKEFVEKMDQLDSQEKELKQTYQKYADAIILNDKGEVLLLRRSITDTFCPDCWSLPGGKVEENETPDQAVVRETLEETNLKIISVTPVLEKEIDNGCIYYFLCTVEEALVEPSIILDNDEHISYEFIGADKWSDTNLILDLEDTLSLILSDTIQIEKPKEVFGIDRSPYSNIIEQIVNSSPNQKDNFMIELLSKGEIKEDDLIDYIFKAHGDASHGGKLTQVKGVDKNNKPVKKWVNKTELKQLAKHAKHTPQADLERVVKEHPHPAIRQSASTELNRREKEEQDVENKDGYEAHEYHGKDFKFNSEENAYFDDDGKKADTQKLHSYYDQRMKEQELKHNQLGEELAEVSKKQKALNNKLITTFYKRIKSTSFKTDDREVAYKVSLSKLESMGLKEEDIDSVKLKGILNKKFNKE